MTDSEVRPTSPAARHRPCRHIKAALLALRVLRWVKWTNEDFDDSLIQKLEEQGKHLKQRVDEVRDATLDSVHPRCYYADQVLEGLQVPVTEYLCLAWKCVIEVYELEWLEGAEELQVVNASVDAGVELFDTIFSMMLWHVPTPPVRF